MPCRSGDWASTIRPTRRVFTTGRITGDLVDARRGLYGDGPFNWLGESFPGEINEGLTMHDSDALEDPLRLPVNTLLTPIAALGLFGGDDSTEILLDAYESFASDIVGGSFETPYLLMDTDDGGRDDTDEYWKLDPIVSGSMVVGPQRVALTCVSQGDPRRRTSLRGVLRTRIWL